MSKNKKIIPIDYTHREYRSIKQDLLGIVERYYPDQFQDFSEASFGSMMLDAVAYVGDQMSFYLDYNVNESFLDTSYSLQNIQRHGRILGYKEKGPASTFGTIAMFLEVPAEASGLGPDVKYIPTLNRGTRFKSQSGLSYLLTENINFSDPKHPIVVSKVGATTGAPTHYAIKAYGSIVSGVFGVEEITVGQYQKFRTLILQTTNVAEILSVIDSDGNKYYEVDNLSQDMVFQEIPNNNFKNDNVPSILKPLLVSRKFVVLRRGSSVSIQFGSGQESSTSLIADPQRVAMDVFGKDYVTSTTFDPTRISKNVNYGIVPSNTKLRILYRKTNPTNSNAAVGTINKVGNSSFDFGNLNGAANSKLVAVRESLEVTNESPIIGQNTYTSPQEIKQQIFDTFPTQNRAVTQADYENVL